MIWDNLTFRSCGFAEVPSDSGNLFRRDIDISVN